MSDHLTTENKVIVFQLKDEEYGIPVQQVQSIERMMHITRIPKVANYVKGVMNLRGVVTPIIDLRKRFGLEDVEYTDGTRIIIVSVRDLEVGLIVDAANDVVDIPKDAIEPPPEVVGSIEEEYLNGVVKIDKRLIILLNLEKVLKAESSKEKKTIEG